MKGRSFQDASYDSYRFGFNGKENDTDFGNKQLIQDYGFRLYNPAIAKFLSVDPLAKDYPTWTPYAFAMNRPIDGVDLDGLEWSNPTFPSTNSHNKGTYYSGRHILESGNTLYSLGLRYGFTALEMATHNKIKETTKLQVGTVLYIPGMDISTAKWTGGYDASKGRRAAAAFMKSMQPAHGFEDQDLVGADGKLTPAGTMLKESTITSLLIVLAPLSMPLEGGGLVVNLSVRGYMSKTAVKGTVRAVDEIMAQYLKGTLTGSETDYADIAGAFVLDGIAKDVFNSAVDFKSGKLTVKGLEETSKDLAVKLSLNFVEKGFKIDKAKFHKAIKSAIKKIAKDVIKDSIPEEQKKGG